MAIDTYKYENKNSSIIQCVCVQQPNNRYRRRSLPTTMTKKNQIDNSVRSLQYIIKIERFKKRRSLYNSTADVTG